MIRVLVLLIVLATPSFSEATTYWASVSGSDSATCTDIDGDTDPGSYGTIGRAAECVTATGANTIYIKAGTYTDSTKHAIDTSPTKRHVNSFASGTGESTRLIVSGAPGEARPTINITNWAKIHQGSTGIRSWITFREFTCVGPGSTFNTSGNSDQCLYLGGHNHRVEDAEISASFYAIFTTPQVAGTTSNLHVRRTVLHDTASYAIYGMPPNSIIEENEIYNYGYTAIQLQYHYSGTVVRRNYIHDGIPRFPERPYCNGIWPTGNQAEGVAASNVKILDNIIDLSSATCQTATQGYGIEASSNTGMIVANNIIYGAKTRAIRLLSPPSSSLAATNMVIKNNILFGSVVDAIVEAGSGGSWTADYNACATAHNCVTSSNGTVGTKIAIAALTDITVSTTNFRHKSGGAGIAKAPAVTGARACNGSGATPCDIGPFETFGFSSASIDTTFMDVTLGMSAFTPVLPSTGITGFTVACTGSDCGTPVVASAVRLAGTDSVVRLTITGIGGAGSCLNTQTWTVTYSPGNVTDSALIGNSINQTLFAFTNQSVTATCSGTPSTPPAGGLVVHYIFEDGSGTTVTDQTAENNDGTLTGNPLPAWVSGGGVTFTDGVDHYVAVPVGNGDNPSTASRTMCWGGVPDPTEVQKIVAGVPNGTNQRFYIGWISGTWGLGIQDVGFSTGSEFPVVSELTHVCVRADSGTDTATLFVNGVKGTSAHAVEDYTSYTFSADVRIGQGTFDANFGGSTATYFKWWEAALTDQEIADDAAAFSEPAPAPTGTYSQVTHKWQRLRKKANGDAEDFTKSGTTNGIEIGVVIGGAVELVTQIDCTGANCDPTGLKLYYSKNGGTFLPVPDSCASDGVCFFGATADVDIVSGTIECCLTGALTENDGTTQFTASAVPNIDLAQNASFVRRSVLKFSSDVSASDTFDFKEYHQTGNAMDAYTPSGGARVTIADHTAGVGF